jgi:hypothetical protein
MKEILLNVGVCLKIIFKSFDVLGHHQFTICFGIIVLLYITSKQQSM